jgi:hypothetical protein
MKPKRPTVVTVLGIINIVFASLGLAGNLCCGVAVLVFAGVFNQAVQDPQFRQMKDLIDGIQRAAPDLVTYFVSLIVLGTILSLSLLIGGIGLLKMKNWARVLCIWVAVLHLLVQAGHFVYDITVIQPAVAQAQQQLLAQAGAAAPPPNPFGNIVLSGFSSIISVAYYIVLLVFLLQPRIAAAFHEQSLPEASADEPRRDDEPPPLYDDEGGSSTAFRGGGE